MKEIEDISNYKINFKYLEANILLFLVLLYLIGPNVRFYNAYIQDILFLFFFLFVVFTDYQHHMFRLSKIDFIFFTPFLIILVTIFGKLISGFYLSWNDYAHLINMIKLFFIAKITLSIFNYNSSNLFFLSYVKKVSKYLGISVIFTSFVGICQVFNIINFNSLFYKVYTFEHQLGVSNIEKFLMTGRITSIFKGFNTFGLFLALSLFLLIIFFIYNKSYILFFALLIGFFSFIYTNSRAAMLTFAFMFISFYLINIGSKKVLRIALFIFIVVILLIILNYNIDLISYESIYRFKEIKALFLYGSLPLNIQYRLNTWQFLPKYIISSRYCIFGFPNLIFFNDPNFCSPDNQYIGWLVKYGMFGLVLMTMWVFGVMLYLIRLKLKIRNKGDQFLIALLNGIIIIWLGMIFMGIVEDTVFVGRWREFFFFLLAFVISWANNVSMEQEGQKVL